MPGQRYQELVIRDIVLETGEMKLFYFHQPEEKNIVYQAGQYFTFVFTEREKEFRRSFSIGSSPSVHEDLYIGVKRIPNGNFSRKLFDEGEIGDTLQIAGTGGVFTLPENTGGYRQLFFFAAGSGIIPVFSLIKTVLYSHPHIKVVLIYSNSSIEQTGFFSELTQLQLIFRMTLHVEFLFSNSEYAFRARLNADLIGIFLKTLSVDALENCLYYLCGPEAYMRLCTFVLQSHHVPPQNIKKEIFHTARPANRVEPPDQRAHTIEILHNGNNRRFVVQYPTSILEAGRNHGLNLPYSCEVGRCGNCMAKCISGQVWMSYNEVLTERELFKGLVLTCTGYPVSDDVKLIFE